MLMAILPLIFVSLAELSGTYTIPSGVYMENPAEFPAPEIEWDQGTDGIISLKYDLPYEVVGVKADPIKLQSVSAQQPLLLRGATAEGLCSNQEGLMSCTISYKKNQDGLFPIDTAAGIDYAAGLNMDAVQIQTLIKAQETLMHEAVGVLNFRLP
jgi:hypothetical protein